nr:HAD-IC family P-type ATPase [Flexivirga aerilata]
MSVREVTQVAAMDHATVLRLAADLESASEHPVARAIVHHAEQSTGAVRPPSGFRALPGSGAEGVVAGRRVLLGRPGLFHDRGLHVPFAAVEAIAQAESDGAATVLVAVDDEVVAAISVADSVKRSAAPAVQALRDLGLRTVLLTGDSAGAARAVARSLGLDDVRAGVLPDRKAATVEQLRTDGHCVAMVGDGINDSAALATADLGIALVRGTDIAMKAADVIVVRHDLRGVVDAAAAVDIHHRDAADLVARISRARRQQLQLEVGGPLGARHGLESRCHQSNQRADRGQTRPGEDRHRGRSEPGVVVMASGADERQHERRDEAQGEQRAAGHDERHPGADREVGVAHAPPLRPQRVWRSEYHAEGDRQRGEDVDQPDHVPLSPSTRRRRSRSAPSS